jgi:hypothetical protein
MDRGVQTIGNVDAAVSSPGRRTVKAVSRFILRCLIVGGLIVGGLIVGGFVVAGVTGGCQASSLLAACLGMYPAPRPGKMRVHPVGDSCRSRGSGFLESEIRSPIRRSSGSDGATYLVRPLRSSRRLAPGPWPQRADLVPMAFGKGEREEKRGWRPQPPPHEPGSAS